MTEIGAEAVAAEQLEATEAPLEGGNGEAEEVPQIPLGRFQEVNEARKALAGQNEELQRMNVELTERLQAIEDRLPQGGRPTELQGQDGEIQALPKAPDNLDQMEQISWYVREGIRQNLKSEMERLYPNLGDTIQGSQTLLQGEAERRWNGLCQGVGLDPADPVVRSAAKGLVEGGMAVEKALGEVKARISGTAGAPPAVRVARAETGHGAVSESVVSDSTVPFTHEAAVKAAKAGKRAPDLSIGEIFEAADRRRQARRQ